MTFEKIFFLLILGSLPLTVLVTVGRHALSAFRSIRSRKYKYAVFSALIILGLPLLSAIIVIFFFYMTYSSVRYRDAADIIVVALMFYGVNFGTWQLARHFDLKSDNQTDR